MYERIKVLIKENYLQVLFVFIAFLAMVLVSYSYLSNIVSRQMLALGEETMNTMQEAVAASLTGSELVFTNVVQSVEALLHEERSNEEILAYLFDAHDYFTGSRAAMADYLSMYAYIRGEFLDGSGWIPPDDYEPTLRPWYTGAEKSHGKMYVSAPYLDADTGEMCISFSQQVFNGQEALGIVAFDIQLARVTDYITRQQIANDGHGVLLDYNMVFVTHHIPDLVGKKMSEGGEGYELLRQIIQSGGPVSAVRFVDADGTDSVSFFRTIFNGWHIGIIVPRSSYYAQVHHMGLALSILGFGLMAALSYLLVRTRVEKIRSEEANTSKSDFLARMSHEMRTPMNAVIGMTEIAKNTDDPEKIDYCLAKIGSAANHLLGVINDVLDMSKIEAGKLELSVTEFPFAELIEQVIAVVSVRMEGKQQELAIDIGANIPERIVADQQRLAQVLTNLLSNATKFTPEGGEIKLVIDKVSETEKMCGLRMVVQDNGIGITKEQQKRLFHSFEQADGSISRKYGGTGLGLSISKQIVNLMGGEIWVESEPNQGSRFIFTVYVEKREIIEAEASGQEENKLANYDGLFHDKHLLLAEDVELNREIIRILLEPTLVKIDCAENGKDAVHMFETTPDKYDLILMDIQMPELDGYEATKMIRLLNLPRAKTIPIIAMTANVFREDTEMCVAAGMNDHLGKPLDLNEVLEKLRRYFATI